MRNNPITAVAVAVVVVVSLAGGGICRAGADSPSYRFDFGPGAVAPGYIQVVPATVYTKQSGYGFDLGSTVSAVDRGGDDPLRGDFCTSDKPFFFSVDLPEGNYNVTVTLGDQAGESTTTVKAESRRLMLEKVQTARGEFATRTFTVNVRTSEIGSGPGSRVKLKAREQGVLHWDDKLTLEFNDTRPCVKKCAREIRREWTTPSRSTSRATPPSPTSRASPGTVGGRCSPGSSSRASRWPITPNRGRRCGASRPRTGSRRC